MHFFDIEAKTWKPLESLAPAADATQCYCAETVGSKLYVAGLMKLSGWNIYDINSYDIERNVWGKVSHSCGKIEQLCTVDEYMYAVSSDCNQVPQRYSFAEQQWQSFAKPGITGGYFFNSGARVRHSKVFVLYGRASRPGARFSKVPVISGPVNLSGNLPGNFTGPDNVFLEAPVNFPGNFRAR